MAMVERKELFLQFQKMAEFINGTEMTAYVLEENPAVPALSLLMGLPEEVKDGHYIVCNLMPLSEEDSAFTHFLQMFYEIPYEVGELDEMTLLRAVNHMNTVTVTGHFMYMWMADQKARIQFRCILTSDVEEELNPSTVCECAALIFRYASVMEEILSGMIAGMDLKDILEAEGITMEG